MSATNTINSSNTDIHSQIKELSHLQNGWDFGEGFAPSRQVIENACFIFSYFEKPGFEYTINPTSNGGIKITAKTGIDFIDLTINPDLTIDLTHERGIGVNFETVYEKEQASIEEIDLYIKPLSIQSCFLSERYTLGSLTTSSAGLTAILLPTSMEGFPYLTITAHSK